MSTDNKLELPPLEKAAAVLDSIHDEVLVNRFMELTGWQLNEKQAARVIEVGVALDMAEQEQQTKQASNDLFEVGAANLSSVLRKQGINVPSQEKQAHDQMRQGIRQAATAVAQSPEMYKAALAVASALANAGDDNE